MFGKLDAAKEAMRRQFLGQFDTYQGTLVYRRLSKGPPIRIDDEERSIWVAEFEVFLKRALVTVMSVAVSVMIAIVGLDESGILPMPDWVPIAATLAQLPFYVHAYRRALVAPLKQLTGRPPMGGERYGAELKQVHLRQMTWSNMIVPVVLGAGISFVAVLAKPEFRAENPYIFVCLALLGGYLLLGGIIGLYQKWQAEKQQENPPQ